VAGEGGMVTALLLALWIGAVKVKADSMAYALEPVKWAMVG
jgi:hypothetical protein